VRRALVSHDHKLIVSWIPKVACQTLLAWFVFGLLGHDPKAYATSRDFNHWVRRNGYVFADRKLLKLPAGYHTVVLCRDPMARSISAFANKFVLGGSRQLVNFDTLGIAAKSLYLRMRGTTDEAARRHYQAPTFAEYLAFVAEAITTRPRVEPDLDPHWNTQVSFRWASSGNRADEMYDLSRFDDAVTSLNGRFGIDYNPARRTTTRYGEFREGAHRLPADILAASGAVPDQASFRSPEMQQLVRTAYAIDYEVLGYP